MQIKRRLRTKLIRTNCTDIFVLNMFAIIMGPSWSGRIQNRFAKVAMPVFHLNIFNTDSIFMENEFHKRLFALTLRNWVIKNSSPQSMASYMCARSLSSQREELFVKKYVDDHQRHSFIPWLSTKNWYELRKMQRRYWDTLRSDRIKSLRKYTQLLKVSCFLLTHCEIHILS